MNILLTSVGRRAYLVRYFQEALKGNGEVHVSNSDDLTVAFRCADKSVITPLIYSDDYIPFLLQYCRENRIDVLLSLFDIDLYVLAKNKAAFQEIGTRVIVSDASFIEICNDKWKTYTFLRDNGFHTPKTWLTLDSVRQALAEGQVAWPLMVKARFGCGSIAMAVAEDEEALGYCARKMEAAVNRTYLKYESASVREKLIFQEMLAGQEYGVDIINDLDAGHRNVIVKKKIAMRAGETDIAETVDCPVIQAEAQRLGRLTGHIGNMDCDFFLVDGVPYVLEMNARFGGGYPFSHIAGCNLPEAIVRWCRGEQVDDILLQAQHGVRAFKELILTRG